MKTDPDILKKLDKEDNPTVTQLGSVWNLKDDTLSPYLHFNLSKKSSNSAAVTELAGLSSEQFDDLIKKNPINRRLLSRICPQAYDLLGYSISSVKAGLKSALSRVCDITSTADMDVPIQQLDPKLNDQIHKLLRELCDLTSIRPFERCVIRVVLF